MIVSLITSIMKIKIGYKNNIKQRRSEEDVDNKFQV